MGEGLDHYHSLIESTKSSIVARARACVSVCVCVCLCVSVCVCVCLCVSVCVFPYICMYTDGVYWCVARLGPLDPTSRCGELSPNFHSAK